MAKGTQIGPAHTLCVSGKGCIGAPMPRMFMTMRPGFSYTTPSHYPPRKKKDKEAYGCIYDKKKKKFTGKICKERNPKGTCIEKVPDTFCKPTDKPCGSPRVTCPVQLIFIKGQPTLRFCKKKGEPGHIVPVASPAEAKAVAEEACASWKKLKSTKKAWPPTFFERKAPEIVKKARASYPDSPWSRPGLGAPPTINPIIPVGSALALLIAVLSR